MSCTITKAIRVHKAGLIGPDDQLGAVTIGQFGHDPADVRPPSHNKRCPPEVGSREAPFMVGFGWWG